MQRRRCDLLVDGEGEGLTRCIPNAVLDLQGKRGGLLVGGRAIDVRGVHAVGGRQRQAGGKTPGDHTPGVGRRSSASTGGDRRCVGRVPGAVRKGADAVAAGVPFGGCVDKEGLSCWRGWRGKWCRR